MSVEDQETSVPAGPPPPAVVFQAAFAYMTSACLSVMVKLGVADVLQDGAQDLGALAAACGANAVALGRVLRVLEMQGIVARDAAGRFLLTAAGSLLRRDAPGSLRALMEWATDPFHFHVYGSLMASVRDGGITFDHLHGEPFFQWLERPENEEERQVFHHAMTSMSSVDGPAVAAAYDFSSFRKIVDIGGGHGSLLCRVLEATPGASGAVAEAASVIAGTKAALAASNVADRCEAHACDFFAAVPEGADCYMMKHIIHDWDDAAALKILSNVRKAIQPGGTLLVIDAVLNDDPAPNFVKFLDIEMLTMVGGKERTENEFRKLLGEAGFRLTRIVPTQSPVSIVEAKPV